MPTAISSATNRWQKVEKLSLELTRICPNSSPGYYWLGVALLRQERTFASIRALRQALLHNDDAPTHLALAEAYFFLKQHKFFQEEISAAIAQTPQDPEPYYVAGRYFYEVESRWNEAVSYFRKALVLNPNHYKALCYLALCLQRMNRYQEAEASFLDAVHRVDQEKASFDLPLQLLASFYLERGRPADAMPYIKRAVELTPASPTNQFVLGKAAWTLHDEATAMNALHQALSLDEGMVEARYLLAQIYRARGDSVKAEQELDALAGLKEL